MTMIVTEAAKKPVVIGGLERQLLTQPKEVKFCRRCVVSNQRPRIVFDEPMSPMPHVCERRR